MAKKSKAKGKSNVAKQQPPSPGMDAEDDELMNDLLAQLESRDTAVQQESAAVLNEMDLNRRVEELEAKPKQSAKSRFQARQARKAATLVQNITPDDEAAQARLEKEAKDEEQAIGKICQQYNRQICEINPDGHCLYSAVADQLNQLGIVPPTHANYVTVRAVAADFIQSHPDDFLPFLPAVEGEDSAGALDSGIMSPEQFHQYCSSVRNTAVWGGEPEIQALSRAFNVPIYVAQGGVPPVVIHDPTGKGQEIKKDGIWLSYHRRMYGLGEHYNSLRPKPKLIPHATTVPVV